jgi:hypothetical protein
MEPKQYAADDVGETFAAYPHRRTSTWWNARQLISSFICSSFNEALSIIKTI